MQRELIGFLFLSAFVGLGVVASMSTQVAFNCGIGCNFSVPDEPYFELWGTLIGVAAIRFPQVDPLKRFEPRVRLWRRAVALIVDLHVVATGALAVTFLFLRITMFAIDGTLSWSVVDPSSPVIGPLNALSAIATFAMIYLYFWLVPKNGRATVGQYIMGFQIVSDVDFPKFWARPVIGFLALASWHIWIWFDRNGEYEGRYWWDRSSGTRPVMVSA